MAPTTISRQAWNRRWATPASARIGRLRSVEIPLFSQELRLNGDLLNHAIEYTVGGFYSTQKTTYYTIQNIGYIVPGAYLAFLGNDPVNANSKAAFATAIIHPGIDGLTITGGVRYTKEHKDYTFVRENPDGTPLSGLAAAFGLGALNGLTSRYNGDRSITAPRPITGFRPRC